MKKAEQQVAARAPRSHSTWSIRNFPRTLRNEVGSQAKRQGSTNAQFLEYVLKKHFRELSGAVQR